MRDDIIVLPNKQARNSGRRAWSAWLQRQRVGSLLVDGDGTILLIKVDPAYRRRGVATALYQAALDAIGTVWHDCPAHCTAAGYAWGQRVGGPRRESCACCPPVVVAYTATPAAPGSVQPPGAEYLWDEEGPYWLTPSLATVGEPKAELE